MLGGPGVSHQGAIGFVLRERARPAAVRQHVVEQCVDSPLDVPFRYSLNSAYVATSAQVEVCAMSLEPHLRAQRERVVGLVGGGLAPTRLQTHAQDIAEVVAVAGAEAPPLVAECALQRPLGGAHRPGAGRGVSLVVERVSPA